MKVKIKKGLASGRVDAPPSKSMAHRILICAGLSSGTSIVNGIAESEDILATIDCLNALGARCEKYGESIKVTGINFDEVKSDTVLKCRESGSTLRFFVPICMMSGKTISLTGSERLLQRPLGVYKDLCLEKGMQFMQEDGQVKVAGPLAPGTYRMAGNVSSQFVSGLLFALPMLDGESKIELITPVESRSYINMTIAVLKEFEVDVYWDGDNAIVIPGGQTYKAKEVTVEGDYSNAAFLESLNLFGGKVEVGNLNQESLQGDKVYSEMFDALSTDSAQLDLSDCPDLGPILFAVSAALNGGRFTGTARLRIKESDRATVMAEELAKFGINVIVGEDFVFVEPGSLSEPETLLYGHNDHRIVMSMAVLSTTTGGVIDGAEAVSKSFPDFFEKLTSLGIEVETIEN